MNKFIKLTLTIVFFIIISAFYSFAAQENEPELIPGSDKPEIIECNDMNTAYTYDDYLIYTGAFLDYKGSNIYIFNPKLRTDNPCDPDLKKASYVIRVGEFGGANKFIGAHENIIFLDQWTGRNFKRLLGIDIDTKSLVLIDTYAEPVILKNEMNYYRTLKAKRQSVRDKIDCPEASVWESEGKQVLYVEKMSVNLSSMKKYSTGQFSCIPSEPIDSVKPRSYGH